VNRQDLDAERRRETLDELEGVVSRPHPYESYLNGQIYRLRRTPIGEFTTEDLRLMIGQGIGLFFLVPIALEVLRADPVPPENPVRPELSHCDGSEIVAGATKWFRAHED
jgi:contact-dependent growth inhibition (CDI) system CdiI-like immunity protein